MLSVILKDSLASTSIETLPGIIFSISLPKLTSILSRAFDICPSVTNDCFFAWCIASSIKGRYIGRLAANKIREGLVVESVGE